ncbi:ABC transporter substrate-binding protein [Actinoplanes rectilineatus]|uniref:ABC transporter substrate-binding protein n=1 Tax=Actinoplanes rectilineatus TaxID=113571 RepID=UPI000695C143|nr:ABC transporter substrate-binding protein [Actinoplanes rectilineatus]
MRRSVAVLASLSLLTGCSATNETGTAETTAGRTVATALGDVTVPGAIDSVVVLEGRRDLDIVLSLGLPLTGYPYEGPETGIALELPIAAALTAAKAQGARRLFLADEINIEAIAAATPDLIVGRLEDVEPIKAQLQAIAPVIPVGTHDDGQTWQQDLRLVADATGTQTRAEELISAFDTRRDEIARTYATQIAATPVAALGYDLEGTEVESGRLQTVILENLGATLSAAHRTAGDDAAEFSPEQTLEAYRDAGALLVMADTDDEWAAAQKDALFAQLPAMRANAVIRTDKMTHEGGPITATHVLDLVAQLYDRV